MSQQKYPKAYEAYQQAVYRDGRNPTFWCSIGVLYYQINQYRDALDAYSRAIRLNPYISEVWYDLGTLVSLSVSPLVSRFGEYLLIINHSMSPATIKSTTPSMRISVPPSWIQQTFTLKPAFSCSVMGRPTAWLVRSLIHQFLKTCIRMPISPAEQLDHPGHNGVLQHSNKLVRPAHQQVLLPAVTGVTTDWPTSIRQPSHQGSLTTAILIAGHSNRHRVSLAQDKSSRCALTLSLLATMVRHIAAHLLHVIIMLCQVHTPHKHKGHHQRNRFSYNLLVNQMVPSE